MHFYSTYGDHSSRGDFPFSSDYHAPAISHLYLRLMDYKRKKRLTIERNSLRAFYHFLDTAWSDQVVLPHRKTEECCSFTVLLVQNCYLNLDLNMGNNFTRINKTHHRKRYSYRDCKYLSCTLCCCIKRTLPTTDNCLNLMNKFKKTNSMFWKNAKFKSEKQPWKAVNLSLSASYWPFVLESVPVFNYASNSNGHTRWKTKLTHLVVHVHTEFIPGN